MYARDARSCSSKAGTGTPGRHRWQLKPRPLIAVLVGMTFASATQLSALELGDIEPRSYIGEPFAARIPLRLNPGEEFSLGCVNILPSPQASFPPGLRHSIEITSGRHFLAVRNSTLNYDPAVGLRVEFACNGLQPRDFVVFLNPAPQEAAVGRQISVQPGSTAEAPAPRVRREGVSASAKARPARPAAAPEVAGADAKALPAPEAAGAGAKTPPAPEAAGAAPLPSLLLLRLDMAPLNTGPSKRVTEAERERLRAIARSLMDPEQAGTEAAERYRDFENKVAALRKQLDEKQKALDAANAQAAAAAMPDLSEWLVYGAPVGVALAGLLAWWRMRRRRETLQEDPWAEHAASVRERMKATAGAPQPAAPATFATPQHTPAPSDHPVSRPLPAAPAPRPAPQDAPDTQPATVDFSATLPEEIAPIQFEQAPLAGGPETEAMLPDIVFNLPHENIPRAAQEAYFTGRFGGSSEDVKILHDLDTVIEQARSIFEDDNDPVKAADLLELAMALHPTEVRPWLALLAIYRKSAKARQYAMVAEKFQHTFPDDTNWPTIQQLGRQIDAGNSLYGAAAAVEGEGPAEDDASQDVIDQWLDVPLDFTSVLLADELRDALTNAGAPGAALAASGR